MISMPVVVLPQLARCRRQRFARRHALAQAGQVVPRDLCGHRAVGGRRRVADRRPVSRDRSRQCIGRDLLDQHAGGADAQRKQQQPAEAEGEGQRRAADDAVVGQGAQHVRRPAGAGGHHVAVEVQCRLGLSGGAGGEGDQAGVVGSRVDVGEARRLAGHRRFEPVVGSAIEVQHMGQRRARRPRQCDLFGQARVDQGVRDLGLCHDAGQLARTKQWHRTDGDAAGLDHAEPAGRQHWTVGTAQQHAVAGHQTEFADQQIRNPIGPVLQFGVAPADRRAVWRGTQHCQPRAVALIHPAVQQFAGTVELRAKLQPRQVEQQPRQLSGRWYPVANEAVDMRAAHGRRSLYRRRRGAASVSTPVARTDLSFTAPCT